MCIWDELDQFEETFAKFIQIFLSKRAVPDPEQLFLIRTWPSKTWPTLHKVWANSLNTGLFVTTDSGFPILLSWQALWQVVSRHVPVATYYCYKRHADLTHYSSQPFFLYSSNLKADQSAVRRGEGFLNREEFLQFYHVLYINLRF
jgi:hypothetical protein